jgi:excisionase family DNA binding protein
MYTVKTASEYLGATEWFVRTQVWGKKIKFLRFGKRIVFDKADLDLYIEGQKAKAA